MILGFLTGVGILLFGVSNMSSAIEKICGNKIRAAINKFSDNRIKSSFFGMVLTFILQSSTASTLLIVGLTTSGIIGLVQAISLIIGSNIGSGLTIILLAFQGFKITEYFGLLATIGVFIRIFAKNPSLKNWGTAICGLGLLFAGLSLMSSSVQDFKNSAEFLNFFTAISNPLLLILIGIFVTVVTNSSFGSLAILSSIVAGTAGSVISIESAAYLMYGINIGTCFTTILVALVTSRAAIRASLAHLTFNIVGATIFSIFTAFGLIGAMVGFIHDATFQIIFITQLFNFVTTALLLPFVKPLASILNKLIKDKPDSVVVTSDINSTMPTLSFIQLGNNANTMFQQSADLLKNCMNYVVHNEDVNVEEIKHGLEDIINQSDNMNNCLLKITSDLPEHDQRSKRTLFDIFVGIKKADVNIIKFLNSAQDGELRTKFTQKQVKLMSDIQVLMSENLNDMCLIMQENRLTPSAQLSFDTVQRIIERLEQIVDLKIKGKKLVIKSSLSTDSNVDKYTSFLNVINYFEQINTNLTDIILSIINDISVKSPIMSSLGEQLSIDKLDAV